MNRAKSRGEELDALRGMSSVPLTWMDVGTAAVASAETPAKTQTYVCVATPRAQPIRDVPVETAELQVETSTSAQLQQTVTALEFRLTEAESARAEAVLRYEAAESVVPRQQEVAAALEARASEAETARDQLTAKVESQLQKAAALEVRASEAETTRDRLATKVDKQKKTISELSRGLQELKAQAGHSNEPRTSSLRREPVESGTVATNPTASSLPHGQTTAPAGMTMPVDPAHNSQQLPHQFSWPSESTNSTERPTAPCVPALAPAPAPTPAPAPAPAPPAGQKGTDPTGKATRQPTPAAKVSTPSRAERMNKRSAFSGVVAGFMDTWAATSAIHEVWPAGANPPFPSLGWDGKPQPAPGAEPLEGDAASTWREKCELMLKQNRLLVARLAASNPNDLDGAAKELCTMSHRLMPIIGGPDSDSPLPPATRIRE